MRPGNKIFLAVLTFLVVYVFSLVLWIQVKPYYGYVLTQVGARFAAGSTGLGVRSIGLEEGVIPVCFTGPVLTERGLGELIVELKIDVSHFTYNVPLALALVAGLFPFFKWRRRYLFEIVLILLFVHLLYVYLFCTLQVFYKVWQSDGGGHSDFVQLFLEFMWTFTQNLIIPFEPFLVAVYLWLRGRESSGSDKKKHSESTKKRKKPSRKRR
jgi:hypothetical protein